MSRAEYEKPANGPIVGELSLVEGERARSAEVASPGYYPSLNGAEIADALRSGVFPGARFTGTRDGDNTVFAAHSEDRFHGTAYLCNREPGELFLTGGCVPALEGPVDPGPYIAKVDATTGRQSWRTYLENANVTGNWIGATNLNILADGQIVTSWAAQVVRIDTGTGRILAHNTLPTGDTPPTDCSFKHLTVAPDGTIILKNQTRPAGATQQGTPAIIQGVLAGLVQPNSHLVALHPETLEVLDHVALPEPCTTPHIVGAHGERIAIYISADQHAYRYYWDPSKSELTQDESWVVPYTAEGQTTGDAPGMMGDWLVIQTNGLPSPVPSTVAAINVHDASKVTTVEPFGPVPDGQMSFAPPKTGTDLDNDRLWSADLGYGKVAGIHLDQATGEMDVEYVVDDSTLAFQPVIGPPDDRVLVISDMVPDDPQQRGLALVMGGEPYKERVTWRDAATGEILAASDLLPPLTFGSLIVPGYGGRFYYPTADGFITLYVKPV